MHWAGSWQRKSIALDPKYPRGYIALAQTYLLDILLGTTESPEQSMAKATELIKKGNCPGRLRSSCSRCVGFHLLDVEAI